MGIFDFINKKKQEPKMNYAKALNMNYPLFSQFGQNVYASDVVQQSIRCICQEIKKLNPQHEIRKGTDITPVYDSIQNVLEAPNNLMTTSDFLEKIVWQLYFNYNAFIVPTWEGGNLKALYPIQPRTVDFLQDNSGEMYVKFTFANSYESTLKYRDIIHVRYNYSINEFMGGNQKGQPDNEALLETLELNKTLLEGIGKALKSSFAINGIVKYNTLIDGKKTEEALAELTKALNNNENGFMALDMKGEFIPMNRNIKLVDNDTLKFIDNKILRYYGVSLPILTGDYTKEQYEAFYQKTIEPLVIAIGQAFTKALFSEREITGFRHRITFYAKELVFMSTSQKLEMIRMLGDRGDLYENEVRALIGLKPLKELEGIRMQSLNYVSVDIAKDYQLKTMGQVKDSDIAKTNDTEHNTND